MAAHRFQSRHVLGGEFGLGRFQNEVEVRVPVAGEGAAVEAEFGHLQPSVTRGGFGAGLVDKIEDTFFSSSASARRLV